ncbi:hypothetical protein CVS47_01971 [Microbacterium lemovicicum]|uniref:Uncharacterized protein n=1 Tax=Microbacterium lemovicicum TaxID=1072463 RepID=A0A3Q9IYR2_9MICO|nr:DUF4064 domain-containing protein [Microbacterium lemovicicum]AZS37336.1 hypothetical protein CVS47_01971 [Microbacterium lemovicicum]
MSDAQNGTQGQTPAWPAPGQQSPPPVPPYGQPQPQSQSQQPYAQPRPPYGQPQPYAQPPYGSPHAQPQQPYGPPQGYARPPQFAAPYAAAPTGTFAPAVEAERGRALGTVALVLALIAFVVPTVIAAAAGYDIGVGLGREVPSVSSDTFDLGLLTPVRGSVLLAEVAFWGGTVLGVWAIVQGIVAAVRNRGRGAGIAAIVIGVLGVFAFGTAVTWALTAGVTVSAASAF